MRHVLDNPIWHALTGPHAKFATGRGLARHYPRDMAAFSAISEPTDTAYADLAVDLPAGVEARLFRPTDEATPDGWETLSVRTIVQMVADNVLVPGAALKGDPETLTGPDTLTTNDAAGMRELVELANPGPFGPRTASLGHYVGYRDGGRLLAMGGERFRLPGFVELSAISVHPNERGQGFGAAIVSHLAHRALARGDIPFLHVFPDNPAAGLYRRLGFQERKRLWVIRRRLRMGTKT